VEFTVNKVSLEQVVLPVLQFCPVSTTPPMFHTFLHLNNTLTSVTSDIGKHETEMQFHF
jgi:hypothetical protein